METKGYVYVFGCDKYYKIGITIGDIRKRLAAVQAGNPLEVTIVHFIPSDQPTRAEKFLHLKFGDKRVRNEWFELSAEDVTWLKKIASISGQYLERFDISQPKPMSKAATTIKVCPICGNTFTADAQKSSRRLYCSRGCLSKNASIRAREKYKANPDAFRKREPEPEEELPF